MEWHFQFSSQVLLLQCPGHQQSVNSMVERKDTLVVEVPGRAREAWRGR